MRDSGGFVGVFAGAMLIGVSGCAPILATTAVTPVPEAPRAATSSPSASAPSHVPTPSSAAVDSSPSRDALRVLAGIPEPLSPEQQMAPAARDTLSPRRSIPAPEAASDTLRAVRAPDSGATSVPVPSPTRPLGSNPTTPLTQPDTVAAPAVAPAVAPTAAPPTAAAPPATTAPASSASTPPAATASSNEPGACWRLQVAAPAEKLKAQSRLSAAQSLLVVPMVIVFEKGLYKVRTRDCMTREVAENVKKRAGESGFEGAFVLDSHAAADPLTRVPLPPRHRSARGAPRKYVKR